MEGRDVESQVGGTQESGESPWLGGGGVESQVEGTQESGESLGLEEEQMEKSKSCPI